MAKSKRILLAFGVVIVTGIAFVAVKGPVVPNEGVKGTMGAAEEHQAEKTRYYAELNKLDKAGKDKIETLGRVAAGFENAPAEAEEMLEEQGWSKKEFDKMVETIQSNDEMNKVFEAAKVKASQDMMKASQH